MVSIDELVFRLNTDLDKGLTEAQVYEILERDGHNVLTPQPVTPKWLSFFGNLVGGFGILLLTGSALCFIAYAIRFYNNDDHLKESLWLGIALLIVDIFSGFFSFLSNLLFEINFFEEQKCKKIINSFKKIVPPKASIVRDGVIKVVKVENIVIGDIVLLKAGDKVPADIRIFESQKLQVDNSSLTGESEPQPRSCDFTHLDPLQTKNLVFLSTLVLEGSGSGIVIRTGDRTFMGQISCLASEVEYWETTLSREIAHFIHCISIAALIIGFTFFILSLLYGYDWLDSVIFLISILVAKVPEGLLATITVALTLIAKRISKKNCLVKNLEGVETLGSITTICCDKTGTLTQNKMVASHIWINNEIESTDSYEMKFIYYEPEIHGWTELSRCFMLSTNATFDNPERNIKYPVKLKSCKGNPSEIAILKFVESTVGNVDKYREKNPKIFEIPFNSINKFQVSVHKTDQVDQDKRFLVLVKGAPEILAEKCSEILMNGRVSKFDVVYKKHLEIACSKLASLGERLFGFCELRLDCTNYPPDFNFKKDAQDNPNFPLENMRFLGLISMIDPPRPGVAEAVEKCKSAGIRIIIITGDHPITAKALARSVGIISSDKVDEIAGKTSLIDQMKIIAENEIDNTRAAVIDGDYLKNLSNDQLDNLLVRYPEIVFARITPHQKVNIVESCQRLGAIVAVTGDGVNDSPALKKADIGIAMGIAGSDVSKEAADMILLDDNFATIEIAIEEGRLIFDNLKKSLTYKLASKIPELMPFILFVIASIPLPLGAITILFIDLGTDLIPSISLAYEKSETDIMKRPPRNAQTDRLVDMSLISLSYGQYGMIAASAGFFTYSMIMTQNGFLPSRLLGISRSWNSRAINDLADSYGQEWTYEQRKILERTCHTGFFVSVVVVQLSTLLVCKTRTNSLFQQKMNNSKLNLGLFIEICLALFLCYTPGLDQAIHMYPLRFVWWIPSFFFSLLLFFYDEIRKYFIRQSNNDSANKRESNFH